MESFKKENTCHVVGLLEDLLWASGSSWEVAGTPKEESVWVSVPVLG